MEDSRIRGERLLTYLLKKEKLLTEGCEEIENRARRNNLRIYGVPEGTERENLIQFTKTFLKELLKLPPDLELNIERAHRSLLSRPADPNAPPRLKVFLDDGMKIFHSAWEALEGLQHLGISAKLSEPERFERELHRIG
ncbi:hypothetical protein EOD39_17394 [Acipenser ruthenus]|uniref:Uncharacterized protein n=1 Tax=Acipenser ruthenus TaxID=7906 RepID=A0A444V3I2_ACIRT|nr:hypothetical protein EOD39_17394 [Acipenser ruthenus]